MNYKFALSIKEKKEMYSLELFRSGVEPSKAIKAAKILASDKPDELLTEEERQIVIEACKEWLISRKSQVPKEGSISPFS